ncbi:MAG TPA: hypothetical protein VH309_05410 [Elusimicrobiota bacterium]|nr:hypothetical protein [Elusimicrobiota bacterium]
MSQNLRRAARLAAFALLSFVLPAGAVEVVIPRVGLDAGLGSAAAPSALAGTMAPGLSAAYAAPALAPSAAPSLSLSAAPAFAVPALPAPAAGAFTPAAAAPALAPSAAPSAPAYGRQDSRGRQQAAFIKNADGVWVGGRVAEQALWINRMVEELSPKIDLGDVLNVMDDAYDEARVKLGSVERSAADRKLAASSVHLEGTRNWVDAILTDADGRHIAVHTHRVYFHPAPGNPASEIAEGIRRVDKYLDKAKADFAPGGIAEQEFKQPFDQVELNFDTRGYKEIADHIRGKEAEFRAEFGDRYKFNYVTEPKMAAAPLRAEYNRLVEKYMGQPEGLMGILDGVTYSREVGVGHELNSHKKRLSMGLNVVQAGRDFFGKKVLPDGRIVEEYKTEFDAVTEPVADAGKPSKDRDVVLWEDKSTRVWMSLEKTMEETFLYKLRIYRENRAIIEKSLGGAPLKVAFSVDVGGTNRRAAKQGVLVWKDPRQKELMEHLRRIAPELSKEYGFPVSFIFVNSHPGEDPDLFDKPAMTQEDWDASQNQGRGGSGRKHGRNSGRRS